MTLTLRIENYDHLDGGGSSSVVVPSQGLQAGRAAGMGWVLPDASRHISGHHFEVYRQGDDWYLRDVSTNGTYLQGHRYRLDQPHRLSDGDRFQVGQYLIVAVIEEGTSPHHPEYGEILGHAGPTDVNEAVDPQGVGSLPPAPPLGAPPLAPLQAEAPLPNRGFAPATPVWKPAPPSVPTSLTAPPSATPDSSTRSVPPSTPPSGESADFIAAFCRGAGLPEDGFTGVHAEELAEKLGQAMHVVSREVMLALQDRATAKLFALTVDRTMRGVTDNNPLKFLPDPEQAIVAMFLRPRSGFQSGTQAVEEALKDLRLHQLALFGAIQPALAQLLDDVEPQAIEAEADNTRIAGNRRAKAWEIFVARWQEKIERHENGILDEFVALLSEAYQQVIQRSRP